MRISVQIEGLKELQASLRGFSDRRMAASVVTALTRTAVEVRDGVRAKLPSIFDRPTPYTLDSLYVRPARADRLEAETYFKDDSATSKQGIAATKYLLPEVQGGPRRLKRFERALQLAGHLPSGMFVVPGADAQLDAYGNMSTGQIIQILSQLRITLTAGHTRNMPLPTKGNERKVINAQRKAGGRYFVIKPGTKGAKPGIYRREFIGNNITPIAMFVKAPSYSARFDFDAIAAGIANDRLQPNLERAIAESVGRLAARSA